MNYIFIISIVLSFVCSVCGGNIADTVQAGFDGAARSVEAVLSFAGIMCMWSGFLNVAQKGGAMRLASKCTRPLTRLLFPRLDKSSMAMEYINANIGANLLGVGNAASPAGICAMEELDKINNANEYPSDEMCIFTVMNTASMQIIPTTVIAMRAAAGSCDAAKIVPAVIVCSAVSMISAVGCMKLITVIRRSL